MSADYFYGNEDLKYEKLFINSQFDEQILFEKEKELE